MPEPAVPDLAERLADLDDPRDARGIRHEIGTVLAVALCALLGRSRSLRAIGQWTAIAATAGPRPARSKR